MRSILLSGHCFSASDEDEDSQAEWEEEAMITSSANKQVEAEFKMLPSTQTALAALTLAATYGGIPRQTEGMDTQKLVPASHY